MSSQIVPLTVLSQDSTEVLITPLHSDTFGWVLTSCTTLIVFGLIFNLSLASTLQEECFE